MSKLLVMTDIHITPPGEAIIGLDPLARLKEALAHAAKHHPDAARLMITGDLTHYGDAAAYDLLRAALEGLPWPVSLMIGNHDTREAFRQAFPMVPVTAEGFVQSVIDLPEVRLITLDTYDDTPKVPHAGYLCEARLDWLERQLQEAGDKPSVLFLHHPPFDTGFDGMDAIGLTNADAFLDRIAPYNVAHIFAGHIHRTITATIAGQHVTVYKSTCHQMPMCLGAEGSDLSVPEPGAYGIVLLRPKGQVIAHFEDFTLPDYTVERYETD